MKDRTRKLLMIGAVVGIAAGTGHVMQGSEKGPRRAASAEQALKAGKRPTEIVPLAATNASAPVTHAPPSVSPTAPATSAIARTPVEKAPAELIATKAALPDAKGPDPFPAQVMDPVIADSPILATIAPSDAAIPSLAPAPLPKPGPVSRPGPSAASDSPAPLAPIEAAAAPDPAPPVCAVALDILVQPGAMLDLALSAPCRAGERVVIRHGGLAVTGAISQTGTLTTAVPALLNPAEVAIQFIDGTSAAAIADVPDLAGFDRLAVQWSGDDAFQIQAYQNGAAFGSPGHISAVKTGKAGAPGGFLSLLGTETVPVPLLAEVYTYPAGLRAGEGPVALDIEATVTAQTCGREILGETILLSAGTLTIRDLSMTMPGCDALGDIVVLPHQTAPLRVAAN